MRTTIILLSLLLTVQVYSETNTDEAPFVQVYKTHDNGLYGRSEDRDMILSLKRSIFKRHNTLEVEDGLDFLTAVVLDSSTVKELENRFKGRNIVQIGFVKITKIGKVYKVEDDNIFLSFSFSYEKPGEELLYIINNHYLKSSPYRKIVSDHYKENYVLRIHSAENVILPEAREITYDEALIMATIIGDKSQWLWGIHDGSSYLKALLF